MGVVQPRIGGPFMTPSPTGAPGYAETTYGRGMTATRTGGGPAGGGGESPYADLLRRLIDRKLAPAAPAKRTFSRDVARSGPVISTRGGGGEGGGAAGAALARLQQQRSEDGYDASVRGSAMRPVGLGPASIPGMMVDPNLLPSRMRPDQANLIPSASSIPRGSVASPTFDPDALYGYSAANPRAEALGEMSSGQADPIEQIMYGRQGVPKGQPLPTPAYYSPPRR